MIELVSRWHLLWRQSPQIQWRRFWSKDKFKKMTKREFHFAEERILWRRTTIAHWWSRVGVWHRHLWNFCYLIEVRNYTIARAKHLANKGLHCCITIWPPSASALKPTLSHPATASPNSMALSNWGSSFLSDLFDVTLCRVQSGILSHPCKILRFPTLTSLLFGWLPATEE